MYKLLIVDDEPLVQVGIKSMLNWAELNIEICGSASNGKQALELVRSEDPDIVITDIKMPVMDGLEFIGHVRSEMGYKRPIFLMLTSYEDFQLAKEAVSQQVLEYLVKVELTPDTLRSAIEKSIAFLEQNTPAPSADDTAKITPNLYTYREKFIISLLNNLFESDEQLFLQAADLHIDLNYPSFLCCYGSLDLPLPATSETSVSIYTGSMQMLKELAGKYYHSLTIALDMSHFAILFFFQEEDLDRADLAHSKLVAEMTDILMKIRVSLKNYCNTDFLCGIGTLCSTPSTLCESYQCARMAYRNSSSSHPVSYFSSEEKLPHDAFNFSLFRESLTRAFEEYDSAILSDTITQLCEIIDSHPHHFIQALDAAINILYLAVSLLPGGVDVLNGIFSDSPDGYMSLYRQSNVLQIAEWLQTFSDGLCEFFDERTRDYKNKIVVDVKNYINEHVTEKISLNQIAAQFGISTSYLSQLFGRYSNLGFNEYINYTKIQEAKRLLREEHLKVYEVADALSFGSEFYFSKVFKKVEGLSPTDYINSGV